MIILHYPYIFIPSFIISPISSKLFFKSLNRITSCFLSVEQYEAYFIACHSTPVPLSSRLFSITTKFPCKSNASKSSLSDVSAKPSNSFAIIINSSDN